MKDKKGFTLLEIVVSLGILAVGILTIFSLIPTGIDQSIQGQEQAKAALLAQSKIEEMIGMAASDWENFLTSDHKWFPGEPQTADGIPFHVGPNETSEKEKWGWVPAASGAWVPDLGYQWVWHFVKDLDGNPPDSDDSVALISLTVSWPQKWGETTGSASEDTLKENFDPSSGGYDTSYFTDNNIQFIRLISYVSKGI